jgi:hypothetical protein
MEFNPTSRENKPEPVPFGLTERVRMSGSQVATKSICVSRNTRDSARPMTPRVLNQQRDETLAELLARDWNHAAQRIDTFAEENPSLEFKIRRIDRKQDVAIRIAHIHSQDG